MPTPQVGTHSSIGRRQFGVAVAIGVLLIAVVVGLRALRPKEPLYQGRPVTAWIKEGYYRRTADPSSPEKVREADEAVRAIGPSAVPFYIGLMESDTGASRFTSVLMRVPWIRTHSKALFGEPPVPPVWLGACALSILGRDARSAIPRVARLLDDGTEHQRPWAARLLADLGPDGIASLTNSLANAKSKGRSQAAMCLDNYPTGELVRFGELRVRSREEFEETARIVVPVLLAYLNDNDSTVRAYVAEGLGNFAREPGKVVPALVERLQDPDATTRYISAGALGKFHVYPELVVPALTKSLRSINFAVRISALQSLAEFGADARSAVPEITRLINSYDGTLPDIRDDARRTLKAIDRDGGSAGGK